MRSPTSGFTMPPTSGAREIGSTALRDRRLDALSLRLADHGKALFGDEMFEGAAGYGAAKHHSGRVRANSRAASSFRHLPFPR